MGHMATITGSNFRGKINDLKRRPEDAAKDLGVSLDYINEVLADKQPLTEELIEKACSVWPLNKSDFYSITDDCPSGVKIMRAEESEQSSRVMDRAGKPYYEYRDTAMSRVSHFRPEWIKELCVVDDTDPQNPEAQWNNGHFMHQFTYFIGPVNFYYVGDDGEKKVAVMNTGDSMYITPFVPHTFTTRRNDDNVEGLILALTYGDKIAGSAHQELNALGKKLGSQYALDFRTVESAFGGLLTNFMNGLSITPQELSRRTNIDQSTIETYMAGKQIPSYGRIVTCAQALHINARDLLPPDTIPPKTIVKMYKDCTPWDSVEGGYTFRQLADTPALPHSKSLELTINGGGEELSVPLHQYVYNVGDKPLELHFKGNTAYLAPNDSFYMKPHVNHSFVGDGKALVLRIGGRIAGEPQHELSYIGQENAHRAIVEEQQWFNPEGKQ